MQHTAEFATYLKLAASSAIDALSVLQQPKAKCRESLLLALRRMNDAVNTVNKLAEAVIGQTNNRS
jgi:hypothetical protein